MNRSPLLAPFTVRSFRFQFPADLLTSWAQEAEIVILGWYVLTKTDSVLLLAVYGGLQYLGTLISPIIGLGGDRFGHRNVLVAMRTTYWMLSGLLTVLAYADALDAVLVFLIAGIAGLIRPSDLATRNALVAETMPSDRLMAAMGVARTTSDSARIFGALAGVTMVATMGFANAYVGVTIFYIVGFALTLGIRIAVRPERIGRLSFWRDMTEGLRFIADTPQSLAGMWLAFLVNLTAFPMTHGLLPYVAKEVYRIGQTGLGTLVASFAFGGLIGCILVGLLGRRLQPGRMTMVFAVGWYVLVLAFVWMPDANWGRAMLVLAGLSQSLSMVPLSTMLLHSAGVRFRGRVMGVRMLAIYGLPLGLVIAGWSIERIGFVATSTTYCCIGLVATAYIWVRWYGALWPASAPANAR